MIFLNLKIYLFVLQLQWERTTNWLKKKPKQKAPQNLLPAVVAFRVFCEKQVFTVLNTDISHYSKWLIYLSKEPVEHFLGSGCFFNALNKLPADLGFFFLQECSAKTLAFTFAHCVCFVIFWFCWCSDVFCQRQFTGTLPCLTGTASYQDFLRRNFQMWCVRFLISWLH